MPRYIDADEVLETMRSNMDMQELYLPTHFIDLVIENMPSADVEPVKRGHWEKEEDFIGKKYKCTMCKKVIRYDRAYVCQGELIFDFCPFCGAEME